MTDLDPTRQLGARSSTPAPAPAAVLHPLGRVRLTGELGAGGMGAVLAGQDLELDREVAVKLIHAGADALALDKFVREARVTARLAHPGIPPIHQLGQTDDGRPFFVMRRVHGRDLDSVLADEPPPRVELLQIFLKVCEAVAYAHDRGVIHRDLKPANVMIGQFGEVLVVDWGLARVVHAGAEDPGRTGLVLSPQAPGQPPRTLDGTVMGTPAYMPPEQAEGRINEIDGRSDVYALGALLYELLTGRAPYSGKDPWAIVAQVSEGRLRPPSAVADVPWELEAVVLRAMAHAPEARYDRVAALIDDIQGYLEGREVTAASYAAHQLLGRWLRRNVALASVVLVALLGLGVAATVTVVRTRSALARESDARRAADRAAEAARTAQQAEARQLAVVDGQRAALGRQLGEALLYRAEVAIDRRQCLAAGVFLAGARRHAVSPVALAAAGLGLSRPLARPLRRVRGRVVRRLANGRWLLWRTEGTLHVATDDFAEITALPGRWPRCPLAASDDGRRLVDVGDRGLLRLRALGPGQRVLRILGPWRPLAIRVGSDPVELLGTDGRMRRWDAAHPQGTARASGLGRPCAAVIESERLIAVDAGRPASVLLAPRGAGQTRRLRTRFHGEATALAVHERRILVGRADGNATLLELPARGDGPPLEQALNGDGDAVVGLALMGPLALFASADGLIRIHQQAALRQVLAFPGGPLRSLHAAGGRVVASGEGTTMVWTVHAGPAERTGGHGDRLHGRLYAVGCDPGGTRVASAGEHGTIRVWDLASGAPLTSWVAHQETIRGLAWSPDGRRLASVGADGWVKLWDVAGPRLRWLRRHQDGVTGVAFDRVGRRLASVGLDRRLRVHEVATGRALASWSTGPTPVGGVVAGADGDWLTAAGRWSADGTPRWRATAPRRPGPVAIDGDGPLAVASGARILLRRAVDGVTLRVLDGAGSPLTALAFLRPGLLVGSGPDRPLRCWDASSGARVGGTGRSAQSLAPATGDRLVCGGEDGLWRVLGSELPADLPQAESFTGLRLEGAAARGLAVGQSAPPLSIQRWAGPPASDPLVDYERARVQVARGGALVAPTWLAGRTDADTLALLGRLQHEQGHPDALTTLRRVLRQPSPTGDPTPQLQTLLLLATVEWVRDPAVSRALWRRLADHPAADAALRRRARLGLALCASRGPADHARVLRPLLESIDAQTPGLFSPLTRTRVDHQLAELLTRALPAHPLAWLERARSALTSGHLAIAREWLARARELSAPNQPGARWRPLIARLARRLD